MPIEILTTSAAAGAEIRGVDLREPLDDATFTAIEDALYTHGVVFFAARTSPPNSRRRSVPDSAKWSSTSTPKGLGEDLELS